MFLIRFAQHWSSVAHRKMYQATHTHTMLVSGIHLLFGILRDFLTKGKFIILPYSALTLGFKSVWNNSVILCVSGADSITKAICIQWNYHWTQWTLLAPDSWRFFIYYIYSDLFVRFEQLWFLAWILLADGIFLTPRGWMQRRCCWQVGTSMAHSSSETVKVRKGSSPSQVSQDKKLL